MKCLVVNGHATLENTPLTFHVRIRPYLYSRLMHAAQQYLSCILEIIRYEIRHVK